MTFARALATLLLACAAGLAAAPAFAQTATTYEVRKGDGLFAISGRVRYPGATRFQIAIAIYRANEDAFVGGSINALREGQVLKLPSPEQVAALKPAEASQLWETLIARPAAAPPPTVAVIKPVPPVVPPKPAVTGPLSREQAAQRYRDGVALEDKGDDAGALKAFLDAAESGHGLAQRKLGQIYDKGNAAVQRDFQASLRWYQKAREQGVEIDKPLPRVVPTK